MPSPSFPTALCLARSISIILLLGPKPWLLLQRTLAASLQEPQRLVCSTGLGWSRYVLEGDVGDGVQTQEMKEEGSLRLVSQARILQTRIRIYTPLQCHLGPISTFGHSM